MNKMSADIKRLVGNLLSRAQKRMELRKKELKATENREALRINGELIKANIYLIAPGSKSVELQNFYDENLEMIEVPLDPALNAAANAARYFKEYKKSYNASKSLEGLIDKDKIEIEYLEAVSEEISRAESSGDIAEIRAELIEEGYIKAPAQKSKKAKPLALKEYVSKEGYKIIVGKNNLQNDYITIHLADKNDLWFHTKGIHGAHVVVFSGGKEVSEETLCFAARLAMENSKAAFSSNVPVDYTEIKNVKKPRGSKPGMVIYTTNKTIFVKAENK